jgi:hypothetical protein
MAFPVLKETCGWVLLFVPWQDTQEVTCFDFPFWNVQDAENHSYRIDIGKENIQVTLPDSSYRETDWKLWLLLGGLRLSPLGFPGFPQALQLLKEFELAGEQPLNDSAFA